MGFRLDEKEIKLTGKKLSKIETTKTGDIYRYRNMLLKIFKQNQNPPLEVETAKYLTNIKTDRILLPRNLLFYNYSFRGYTYKLISRKKSSRMIMLPKEELIDKIQKLENDIEILSKKNILLNEIIPENTIFNGDLYITDPTSYTILDLENTEDLEVLNKYQLHLLLIALFQQEIRKNNFPNKIEKQIKEILEMKDIKEDSSEFIKDIIGKEETMKQFIKKME